MSHIREPTVLMENNLTKQKGVDITFNLFIMTKIDLHVENKSWILLSPLTTIDSYSKNEF